MDINISKILFTCFLFSVAAFPQNGSGLTKENENTLSRKRILFGYSSVISLKKNPDFRNIFINVDYRTSEFNPTDKPFRVNWAFETGINALNIREIDFSGFVLVPYLKGGPEMNLTKNIFIGGCVGLASSVIGYFAVFPYAGVNSYFLLPINDKSYWEVEAGFHTTFYTDGTPYLIYISAGFAIK